jgi:hypothetical protein
MSSSGNGQNPQPVGRRRSTLKKSPRKPSDDNNSQPNANIPSAQQLHHKRVSPIPMTKKANVMRDTVRGNVPDTVQDSEYKYIIPPPTTTFTCKYLKYEQPASKIKLINDLYATAYDKIYNKINKPLVKHQLNTN